MTRRSPQAVRPWRRASLITAYVLGVALSSTQARATEHNSSTNIDCAIPHWVAAWTASPVQTVLGFEDRTYRSMITVHYPGRTIRIRLTNELGHAPVALDDVTVARAADAASLQPSSLRTVTFNRKRTVTIPAGRALWSDPVALLVGGMGHIAVSFYAAGSTGPLTAHTSEPEGAPGPASDVPPVGEAMESRLSFISTTGDHTRESSGASFVQADTSTALVNGIDVLPSKPATAVVAIGDSITDGFLSTPNADAAWPDWLARRLLGSGVPISVVNAGISGGQVIGLTGRGPRAVDRFTRDVVQQSGVRAVIIFEGINDIASAITAQQLIAGYQQLIDDAHRHGLRAIGATMTPSGDLTRPFPSTTYSSPASNATRHLVNDWITNSGRFDAVIDFEDVVADATIPEHWRNGLSYDDLHGNDQGYRTMANAIPLNLLGSSPCR